MSTDGRERAWVEVDSGALCANYREIEARLPAGCQVMPMVKADGYGLGAEWVMRTLGPLGPWGFGVATAAEGASLRSAGWAGRVLVFAPTLPTEMAALLSERLEPALPDMSAVELLVAAGQKRRVAPTVHVEVDTGMGRSGFGWEDADTWVADLARNVSEGRLILASTFTHFHSAETDEQATRRQWGRFEQVVEVMREAGVSPGFLHAANSAASILYPSLAANVVRPGYFLYGGMAKGVEAPRPVMSVRARVASVRDVRAGQTVSYGATYTAPEDARLATVAIGYGDGLPWRTSEGSGALVAGQMAPIRGAVCMDSIVLDVTGIPGVQSGDEVTLLGTDGQSFIGLEALAEASGTIGYEILTGWTARLPRVEVGDAP